MHAGWKRSVKFIKPALHRIAMADVFTLLIYRDGLPGLENTRYYCFCNRPNPTPPHYVESFDIPSRKLGDVENAVARHKGNDAELLEKVRVILNHGDA